MKIFLSHSSRDQTLVRNVKQLLPSFLNAWLDEDSLRWGGPLTWQLESTIRSDIDFLLIFLDKDALNSDWVKQELHWAMERERQLKRTFVLPILLEDASSEKIPAGLSDRLGLKLSDQYASSIEDLAKKITMKLFQLVVENYSSRPREVPSRESLISLRDKLTVGQHRLLGYLVEKGKDGSEIAQRQIEQDMGYSHHDLHGTCHSLDDLHGTGRYLGVCEELYYRLESLIYQGFVHKRRMATDGQFSYALTEEFRSQIGKP